MIKKFIILLLVLGVAGSAFGATCTVGSDKDETTIQACFDNNDLGAGDEIIIDGGTYAETITWGTNDEGTVGNPVVLKPATGETVTIDATGLTNGIVLGAIEYAQVENITVTGATADGIVVAGASGGDYITFNNVVSHDNGSEGFYLYGNSVGAGATTNIIFNDCVAYNNEGHGYQATGFSNTITYNDCISYNNGSTTTEKHGFSTYTQTANISQGAGVWTQVAATNIWYADMGSYVAYNVIDFTAEVRFTEESGTCTSDTDIGEFCVDGNTLYINIGSDPNTNEVLYARSQVTDVTYNSCTSYSNIGTPGEVEGLGFVADSFSGPNITYSDCHAYGNNSRGFSFAYVDTANISDSVSDLNGDDGVSVGPYANTVNIYHTTIIGNDNDTTAVADGIAVQKICDSVDIRNNLIKDNETYGIVFSLTGITNETCSHNATYNNGVGATSNITNANAVTVDPQLSGYIPQTEAVRIGGTKVSGITYEHPTSGCYLFHAPIGVLEGGMCPAIDMRSGALDGITVYSGAMDGITVKD